MSLKFRVIRLSLMPFLLGGIIGCNPFTNSGVALPDNFPLIQINELQQQRNSSATVYLQGKVGNQAPFLGSGAYQLQDNSGTIWVITNNNLPPLGEEILIEGQIKYQSISIEGQELGDLYVLELKQLEEQPLIEPPTETIEQPIEQPAVKPNKPVDDLFLPHKSDD